MKQFRLYVLAVLSCLGLNGCLDPPEYPLEPVIEFSWISKDSIVQFDSLNINFTFTDGDGDLGFQDPDPTDCDICKVDNPTKPYCGDVPEITLLVFDNRTLASGCIEPFNIPFIPEKGSSKAISGDITVTLSGIFCRPVPSGRVLDTVVYSIVMRDRAGNLSDTIVAPPVIITCQ